MTLWTGRIFCRQVGWHDRIFYSLLWHFAGSTVQQSQLALEKLVDEVDQEDEYCHSCQVPDGSPDGDDDYDCQGQNDQVLDGIVVCHVHPICRVMI